MHNNKSYRLILNIILVCLSSFSFSTQAFSRGQAVATVNNNSVIIGDVIQLTITVNNAGDKYSFDPTPLDDDFNVSSPSTSQQRQYINGVYSRQTQWIVSIQPKKLGKLQIPAFKIGDLYTRPIIINVKKASQKVAKIKNTSVFIKNSLNKKSIYLGQPLILTTVLFIDKAANGLVLNSPVLENATIKIAGADINGKTVRNGIEYETITRKYEINANKKGKILIKSPLLTGTIRKIVPVNNWQNRVIAQPINIRGDALNVIIKTLPKAAQGTTLVSDDVKLFDNSDFAKKTIYAGDPITRKVTLLVASITEESIPTIHFNYPKTFRFYPDKDKITKVKLQGETYVKREMEHAIIADRAGKFILPEIKLEWWNTKTDKKDYTILPERILTILPAKNTVATTTHKHSTPQNSNQSKTPLVSKQPFIVNHKSLIYWQIVTFILLILLLSLMIYHLYSRKNFTLQKNDKKSKHQPNDALIKVTTALKTNSPSTAYLALLRYSQLIFPEAQNLSQIIELTALSTEDKASLAKAIKKLSLAYTEQSTQWDHQALLVLLTEASNKGNSNKEVNVMNLNEIK